MQWLHDAQIITSQGCNWQLVWCPCGPDVPDTDRGSAGCAQTYNMQVLNASAGSVAVSAVMYWQALGANAGSSSVALILQARLLRLGLWISEGLRSWHHTVTSCTA